MRVVILLSLFYVIINGFELSRTQVDKHTTQLSLSTIDLSSNLSQNYFNMQTCKVLTSHYNLNYEDNKGLSNIDLINIQSLKFNHWAIKDFDFNIFQTLNKNIKEYNLYGIYSASHNLKFNIFTFTNSINTVYDEAVENSTLCTHSSNISAQILKNTKIGTILYQDETHKYNANYYINTKLYKNLYLDLSLDTTQTANNFYTKFKFKY